MNSLLKRYDYTVGNGTKTHITITGERTDNDINGNPQWLLQVWSGYNQLYYPKIKGHRKRTDQRYKVQGYILEEEMDAFANMLIEMIKGYYI